MKQFAIISTSVLLIWAFCANGGAQHINDALIHGTTKLVENSSQVRTIQSGLENPSQDF